MKWARWILLGWLAVGLFAPALAGDVPVLARVEGKWTAPAWSGARPPGDALTWKEWWASLPAKEPSDWALFPVCRYGPREVAAARASAPPSAQHPLGCDDVGRDLASRVVHGARTALLVAGGSVAVAGLLGLLIGGLAGLLGGAVDRLGLWLIELFTCFPAVLALLAVQGFVGGGLLTVVVVLGVVQWPAVARVVRGELLVLRELPHVQAARGFGESMPAVLGWHLGPWLRAPLGVAFALLAVEALLAEATLGFLGLGLEPAGGISWGAMLDAGRRQAHSAGAIHLWLVPAAAIATVVLALHGAVDRTGGRGPRPRSTS